MTYSITKNGVPLDKSLYTIDKKTKTFSSNEDGLVLDFINEFKWAFDTGYGCTFNTGPCCTFNTGYDCTFKTGSGCTFKTGSSCTFNTGSGCTFNTENYCTFNTGPCCTFNTGPCCTFNTGYDCTFKTGGDCVVVRRDVYEVIELKEGVKIKLNGYGIKGYEIIEDEKKKEEITAFNKEDVKKKIFELISKLTGE